MNNSFWVTRAASRDGEKEGNEDPSGNGSKRTHQWLTDYQAPQLFSNKKQATDGTVGNRPIMGTMQESLPLWRSTPTFPSAPAENSNRLFGCELVRNRNVLAQDVTSLGAGNGNIGPKDLYYRYANNSVMGLPVPPAAEDPLGFINLEGARNVRINEVRDPRKEVFASAEALYGNSSLGALSNINNKNPIRAGSAFPKGNDGSFILMGCTINKDDGGFTSISGPTPKHTKEGDHILLMGQCISKGGANFTTMGPLFQNGNDNVIAMLPSYNKGYKNFIPLDSNYDKTGENFPMSQNQIFESSTESSTESNATSVAVVPNKPATNPTGAVTGGNDALMTTQNPIQTAGLFEENNMVQVNADQIVSKPNPSKAKRRAPPKPKEPKQPKPETNSFPANVKSLLSTGIFEGVCVKYVSWSREKSVKATIKGSSYLCGCDQCKFSKAVNAYELERHANCKTKHPNNHIYFDNGKTVYGVVQELKSTPQDKLFSAIENATGSPINQENFEAWKGSYAAASRELERIYSKDDTAVAPSGDESSNM